MRSSRRERAPASGDRSPGPRCAAAARPALPLPAPSRGRSKGQPTNLTHQTPLKSHRQKPGIPRTHEPSRTEFSRNPVSRNGLTHENAARNFAQLARKTGQRCRRAHKTRPPDALTRAKRRPNARTRLPIRRGQRLMPRGSGRRNVVAEASEAGPAPWSRQVGPIHGGRGRSSSNRVGRPGTRAACGSIDAKCRIEPLRQRRPAGRLTRDPPELRWRAQGLRRSARGR
jgi:hypothetical protein